MNHSRFWINFAARIRCLVYEKGIIDTVVSHITWQLWREEGAEREGSYESENTGGFAWYGG
jgi:hypothetical protein